MSRFNSIEIFPVVHCFKNVNHKALIFCYFKCIGLTIDNQIVEQMEGQPFIFDIPKDYMWVKHPQYSLFFDDAGAELNWIATSSDLDKNFLANLKAFGFVDLTHFFKDER